MDRTLSPEIRIEGDRRIEIDADFSGGWTIWIWPLTGPGLLAHREVNCAEQIEPAISLMCARLNATLLAA